MMKIGELTEESLRSVFVDSQDVRFHAYQDGSLLIYCEGMADTKLITQSILPYLYDLIENDHFEMLDMNDDEETVIHLVLSGYLLVYDSSNHVFYKINISNPPNRTPEESATEPAIKGSRDGFTEDVQTNVALIRKRLQTNSLCCEKFNVGKRGHAQVVLLYIKDIAAADIVEEARKRIKKIDVDAVLGSGQMEEYLSDSPRSIFPLVDHIGRPDYAAECLLRGRFVVFTAGSPIAVIAPCSITSLIKSSEDAHFPYYYSLFERILRLIGLIFAIGVPGAWVSLTSYNFDLFPFPLLTTISQTSAGIPFPSGLDLIIMLTLFELFREAGMRLPKPIGITVTVIGGLIIGDAAIRSGITSPSTLMVGGTTAVATFSLANQTLSGTVSVIRLFVLLFASILGMYGFLISLLIVLVYTSNLTSFGIPYWSPVSEMNFKDSVLALLNRPNISKNTRPESLNPTDSTRQGGGQK